MGTTSINRTFSWGRGAFGGELSANDHTAVAGEPAGERCRAIHRKLRNTTNGPIDGAGGGSVRVACPSDTCRGGPHRGAGGAVWCMGMAARGVYFWPAGTSGSIRGGNIHRNRFPSRRSDSTVGCCDCGPDDDSCEPPIGSGGALPRGESQKLPYR